MKLSLLVATLIAFNLTLLSQTKLDSLITAGDELSFQFNFDKANKVFEEVIAEFPNSSLGYYFLSRNSLWFYLANKDSISKNNYINFFKIAMAKGELEFEKSPDDAVSNFNLGNIYLLKSIYSSTEQNTMDAFWATKSAVNYFEDAIDYDENYFAPYLPLGTIKYALGFVPGFLGWAISVAGLEGEKQEGLNSIRTAFTKCEHCKTEAAYHLGKLYTEYNAMYDSAEIMLSKIVDEYPNNELFLYQYAILLIDKKELRKAEDILNRILLSNTAPKFIQTYALSFFLKGEIFFKQNKFSDAIIEYELFISKTISPDYTGIANLKIALAYEMLDEKLLAQKHYILARNGNDNISEDSFADEMSKKLYDVKFLLNDKLMIEAKNNYESGKYLNAIVTLRKIDSTNISNEMRFNTDIIKIETFQSLNDFNNSSRILNKYSDNIEIDEYIEFSKYLYLSAVQKYKEGKYSSAKDYLDSAFENIKEDNYKLLRLLVNLRTIFLEKNK